MRAVERLEQEGLSPKFLQLDVCSMESIKAAKQVVEEQYGRLDILVHSAGLILTVGHIQLSSSTVKAKPECTVLNRKRKATHCHTGPKCLWTPFTMACSTPREHFFLYSSPTGGKLN